MIPKEYQQYENVVTIAVVNFPAVWGDKKANLEKMKDNIVEAAAQGCNIIVFPELALSGYDCEDECGMHREVAETIPGPSTLEIADLAARHNIHVILGMPEKDKADPEVRYISAPLIGPEGIIGVYRKLHLAPPPLYTETICFCGGQELPVFETRYGPIGIQICADFWMFPELSRILALKGARLIINLTGSSSGPGKPYFMVQQTGARATENFVYTASANLVGKELKRSFYGHSTIAGPAFPRLVHIYAEGGEEEEIVSATLSFERLHRLRELLPIDKMRRTDLILKEFMKLAGVDESQLVTPIHVLGSQS